jgi:hypothetical protein
MLRCLIAAAVLAVLLGTAAAQSRVGCGPASATCGPAIVGVPGGGGAVVVIVPAGGVADGNCPATIPPQNATSTMVSYLNAALTCPTPARATAVQSISFYAGGSGTTGTHQKCSVYTFPGGYVAGTTSIPKVAAGCDTVEWTAPGINVNSFVTLAVTGTCNLAASTRYFLTCNADNAFPIGYATGSCTTGGVQCWQSHSPQDYATAALPDPWTANGQGGNVFAFYMTVK